MLPLSTEITASIAVKTEEEDEKIFIEFIEPPANLNKKRIPPPTTNTNITNDTEFLQRNNIELDIEIEEFKLEDIKIQPCYIALNRMVAADQMSTTNISNGTTPSTDHQQEAPATRTIISNNIDYFQRNNIIMEIKIEEPQMRQCSVRLNRLIEVNETSEGIDLNEPIDCDIVRRPAQTLYECYLCNHSVGQVEELRAHMKKHADRRVFFSTDIEGVERIPKQSGHQKGILKQSKSDSGREKVNPKQSKSDSRRQKKISKQPCLPKQPKSCSECGKKYSTTSSLQSHYRREHTGERPFACDKCPKKYSSSTSLNMHKYTHKEKTLECSVCHKKYGTTSALRQCEKRHLNLKEFKCDGCSLSFASNCNLTRHKKRNCCDKVFNRIPFGAIFECHMCGYICPHAPREFSKLRHHMRHHTGEKPFSCDECSKKFKLKSDLTTHKISHSNARPFECQVCLKSFKTKSSLAIHLRSHTGEKPFACSKCPQKFSNSANLYRHLKRHRERQKFECKKCTREFEDRFRLADHITLVHLGDKSYTCNKCPKSYASSLSLQTHQKSHEEKVFACDQCTKEFSLKSSLDDHKKTHLSKISFSCNECRKNYSSKTALHRHRKCHTDKNTFECDGCNKFFSKKSARDEHRLVHTGEKPFACGICQKTFRLKQKAKLHQRTCTGPNPFECRICLKKFKNENDMNVHTNRHSYAGPLKVFECYVCKHSAIGRPDLLRHMVIHTGEKAFICNETGCGKKFSFKDNLDVHKLIHSDARNFHCDRGDCKKSFKTKDNLSRHKVNIHLKPLDKMFEQLLSKEL